MDTFFAVTAPGLKSLALQELTSFGFKTAAQSQDSAEIEEGGVSFEGTKADLYRANLFLRTPSRVLVRLGTFGAKGFEELLKKAARLAWERYLTPGQPAALHVTCHKSRLYHSDAVAERVVAAIGDHLGKPTPLLKPSEAETADPPQLVVVRLVHDQCTISIDSSGELLHRRGYRLATAKAPLRETLASGMLLASGWDRKSPLVDPFCGSGTIAIEAALLALGLAPGRNRRFAFMSFPGFDSRLWIKTLAESKVKPPRNLPLILASDRDAGAIDLARENAERAGVSEAIEFSCRAVSAIEPPPAPGWVITNPPYGVRLDPKQDLRNLYAQFGNVLRRSCPGWQVAILCSDLVLLGQIGFDLETAFTTVNGGINVRLSAGKVI